MAELTLYNMQILHVILHSFIFLFQPYVRCMYHQGWNWHRQWAIIHFTLLFLPHREQILNGTFISSWVTLYWSSFFFLLLFFDLIGFLHHCKITRFKQHLKIMILFIIQWSLWKEEMLAHGEEMNEHNKTSIEGFMIYI